MSEIKLPGKKPFTRMVQYEAMRPHPVIERDLDQVRADKIAANWHPALVGTLLLSSKDDGELLILDGMHRWAAALRSKRGKQTAECHVFAGLSLEEEAALFTGRNDTKRLSPVDLFKASVIQKDPVAVQINALIEAYGWRVGSNGERTFMAVQAAQRVFRAEDAVPGAVALERALAAASRAWNVTRKSATGHVIEGLGLFYLRYGNAIKSDELTERLAKAGIPNMLVGRARAYGDIHSMKVAPAMGRIILDLYNKKPRRYPLPGWEDDNA